MSQTTCYACGNVASGIRGERGWLCESCGGVGAPEITKSKDAGMIASNVRGVADDGSRPDGACSWEWRPPRMTPDKHHDQPIVIGNTLQFQQSPPIHVNGTAPKRAAARGRGAARVEARHDVEAVLAPAMERLTDQEREVYRLRKLVGLRRNEIAERLKMTRTAVKKALERACAKVRKETLAL